MYGLSAPIDTTGAPPKAALFLTPTTFHLPQLSFTRYGLVAVFYGYGFCWTKRSTSVTPHTFCIPIPYFIFFFIIKCGIKRTLINTRPTFDTPIWISYNMKIWRGIGFNVFHPLHFLPLLTKYILRINTYNKKRLLSIVIIIYSKV